MPELGGKAAGKAFCGGVAYGSPVEVLKDRLYFHTVEGHPKSNASTHLFSVDNQVTYERFTLLTVAVHCLNCRPRSSRTGPWALRVTLSLTPSCEVVGLQHVPPAAVH